MKRDRGAAAAEDHPDSRAPVRSGERPMTDQCDLGEGIGGPIPKQFLQTFTIRGERETVRRRETDRERESLPSLSLRMILGLDHIVISSSWDDVGRQ
jgi:hypothetical protein